MIPLTANGHAWRNCICGAIECGHDYDEGQVRELFSKAADWARKKGHPVDRHADYAGAYLASLDRHDVEPEIPPHVRLFCAEVTDLKVAHPEVTAVEADTAPTNRRRAGVFARKPKPPHRPSMAVQV